MLTDVEAAFLRARANRRAYRTEDDIKDGVWTYRPYWAAPPESISVFIVAALRVRGLDCDRGITPAGCEVLAQYDAQQK